MDHDEAIESLRSKKSHERLAAARFLVHRAEESDRDEIVRALRSESVSWVRDALRQALSSTSSQLPMKGDSSEAIEGIEPESYLRALRYTTKQLVHEIESIVGIIRFYAKEELPNFNNSKTAAHLSRLESLLDAIDRLGRAAASPRLDEVTIPNLIREVVEEELIRRDVKVSYSGPDNLIVTSDPVLLRIALSNGIRNAFDATERLPEGVRQAVVVSWGETSDGVWIAVIDNGPGLPLGFAKAFDIGVTTKPNHLGMGLALAKAAVQSLEGSIDLRPRSDDGGAVFRFHWPKN